MNRDDFTRCKHCGVLWNDEQCIIDDINGLQCPSGCKEQYQQPDYESPLQNDNQSHQKEM
jgi:hypothetical protein